MGIVSTSDLRNIEQFKRGSSNETIAYKIDEQDADSFKYSLNPDHTHFILVDDDNLHIKLLKFRVALEKRLQKPIFCRKSKRSVATLAHSTHTNTNYDKASSLSSSNSFNLTDLSFIHSNSTVSNEESKQVHEYDKIPIVCLLIGGGIGSISLVLTKIYQGIPVLAFKGTGHAPDLICGTYEDFADR